MCAKKRKERKNSYAARGSLSEKSMNTNWEEGKIGQLFIFTFLSPCLRLASPSSLQASSSQDKENLNRNGENAAKARRTLHKTGKRKEKICEYFTDTFWWSKMHSISQCFPVKHSLRTRAQVRNECTQVHNEKPSSKLAKSVLFRAEEPFICHSD